MSLLEDWKKQLCSTAANLHPNPLHYLEGNDFPVRVGENKFLYKTHKKNIKHQRVIRAQSFLTTDGEYVGADLGYFSTEHLNVVAPFSECKSLTIPTLGKWNKDFNSDQ